MAETLAYTRCGDYYIPSIQLNEAIEYKPLGKYDRMKTAYLQEYRPALWNSMVLSESLFPHLREIVETAHRCLEQLMSELMKSNGVTERLKVSTRMKRVGLMKALKSQAEEMIFDELIYT